MNKLIIVGAGGHGKVALEIAALMGLWTEINFVDDNKSGVVLNHSIIGNMDDIEKYKLTHDFFVAIGNNHIRKEIQTDLNNRGFSITTLVHPKSVISNFSTLGEGTIVMAGSIINPDVNIGRGCIINTNSSIDHDCKIGDFVHISPGVSIGGTSKIGDRSWICIGSTIINDINISSNIIVGAKSCVIRDLKENGTYVGSPAILIKIH